MSHRLTLSDLADCGAHQHGHFQLSSGLHSADYLQCAVFLALPQRAASAGRALAGLAMVWDARPQLVVSPAIGGLIIGHETARALAVPFLFTERSEGRMALRRGFATAPGQRVLVVEDVVTTGGSVREVIDVVREQGGLVTAVAALANRSGTADPFPPLAFSSLLTVELVTWDAADCPLCRDGVPLTKPGSRPIA